MTPSKAPVGVAPVVTAESAPFWEAAARGELLVERCSACGHYVFPPRGVCAKCGGRQLTYVPVEGTGRIYSFTVNYNSWMPGMEVPYVLALVEFPEYPGFRVLGRLRGFDPDVVAIGTEVGIGFEPGPNELSIPSFLPVVGLQ